MAKESKKPKPENSAQSAKFVEAARALECDEDETKFDETLKRVARHKGSPARGKSLDEFWERARKAAEKEGFEPFIPSFPVSQDE